MSLHESVLANIQARYDAWNEEIRNDHGNLVRAFHLASQSAEDVPRLLAEIARLKAKPQCGHIKPGSRGTAFERGCVSDEGHYGEHTDGIDWWSA